jgi:hypothetical protein
MDKNAVRIANQRLWNAHPELGGRSLSTEPADTNLRAEWNRYYQNAVATTAPPPKAKPSPAKIPTPASIIVPCPLAPAAITTTNCADNKNHVQEGDVVLRGERGDSESEFISKISKCNYSHAGIVAKNDKGELVVVDAYPGRTSAVGANSVDDFFCGHGATQGLAVRPKDCLASKKAAQWAMEQTKEPDYVFDIWDPWNNDPKRLYCADFVYQSYQNAGVDLVPDKMDFLSDANRENTLSVVKESEQYKSLPLYKRSLATDQKIADDLLKKAGGSSEYITPCQVANNPNMTKIVTFDKPAPTPNPPANTKKF